MHYNNLGCAGLLLESRKWAGTIPHEAERGWNVVLAYDDWTLGCITGNMLTLGKDEVNDLLDFLDQLGPNLVTNTGAKNSSVPPFYGVTHNEHKINIWIGVGVSVIQLLEIDDALTHAAALKTVAKGLPKIMSHQDETGQVSMKPDLSLFFTVPKCHGTEQEVGVLHRSISTKHDELLELRTDNCFP